MNLRQKYNVERIIKEIVINNKNKPLNEIKRIIKAQIRLKIGEEIASKISTDEIIKVITSRGVLRPEVDTNTTTKKEDKQTNGKVVEKER